MTTSEATFQCQQCGGVARPVAGRDYLQCDFCRSLVFTSANPLTVDRITPQGGQLDAQCPNCAECLQTGQVEERPALYCGGCFGLLLKNEDFGAIVRQRRARRLGGDSEACKPLDTTQYDRHINCPNCQRRMEVHPYYGPGNIVIDSCQHCEFIWLDHGELSTVERAEGGREPEPLPLHVNADGDVTIIPPPVDSPQSFHRNQDSPLTTIADVIFGL